MKKVSLADQLELSKEVIASLNDEQLQEIEGGAAAAGISCITGSGSCSKTQAEAELSE
ncbi:class I lanthipeptide [Hymenobacter metallilatus]|uniref:class I lanthipeptide n=1 Tax=Hymenobacter metallilatus TaxID=2493666 RepID=UPI00163AE7B6|nr:class I lanthipeptide [Hymenobacter metallilatus]